ncbi:hypothetical protein Shel_04710 [Slackia heliotrinireducens DSM 20476]|uniref:Uncharacterized protein n=1 Tax=Slackia heliotrinireducens (strain ATCC 29202 / DSM 20476 / NCTC 11029 / RHS 1) TaxID=471855 RepID=C7N310_SLAHD|nr:hypothetical protein Shel_04710 [Slackia heliotrinireducens DSM 20476]
MRDFFVAAAANVAAGCVLWLLRLLSARILTRKRKRPSGKTHR